MNENVTYVSASGGEIAKEGEIKVVHREQDGSEFGLVIQHAKVNSPNPKREIIRLPRLQGNL